MAKRKAKAKPKTKRLLLKQCGIKYGDSLYVLFRVLVGFLFFQHGAQKVLGWWGGTQVASFASLMGVVGIFEFVGGLLIIVGLFTRLTALVGGIEMLVAYFQVHMPQGMVPIMNKGELALLYVACFIVLFIYGGKKWSLGHTIFKR